MRRVTSTRSMLCLSLIWLLASCGYAPTRRILFGGISSSGNHPDDEPTTSDKPASGQPPSPDENDPTQVPLRCEAAMSLVGARFRPAPESPFASTCGDEKTASSVACVTEFNFTTQQKVEVRYGADLATASLRFSSNRFDQCDDRVSITFVKEVGLSELHEFRLSVDGQSLIHLATERVFLRIPTP